MLTTWLIELYLNALGTLKDEGDMDGHQLMQGEFHTFLRKPGLRVGTCMAAHALRVTLCLLVGRNVWRRTARPCMTSCLAMELSRIWCSLPLS